MWLLLALPGVGVGLFPAPMPVPPHFSNFSAIGYREKIAELCRTHIANHRVRATAKHWFHDKARYRVNVFDTHTFADVHGLWGWVHIRDGKMTNDTTYNGFHYLDPWGVYISEDVVVKTKMVHFVQAHAVWEVRDMWWYDHTFRAFVATRQIYQPSRKETLVTHQDVTFEGRPALRLVTRDEKQTRTVHIAKDTYQLLAAACDEPNGELQSRVTYREADGKRYPTRYRESIREADGGTRLVFDLEIVEYVRHVPTPDELDIEKRFGVQLPDFRLPPPPDPVEEELLRRFREQNAVKPPPNVERRPTVRFVVGLLLVLLFLGGVTFPLWRRRRRAG